MAEKIYLLETIRTNTFKESFPADLSSVWQAASAKFTDGSTKYAVYHNYDNDFKGDYDLSIAVSQPSSSKAMILEGKYEVFSVNMDEANPVAAAWAHIWEQPLKRAYTKDFEKYSPDGNITIHIAIRE